MPRTRAREGETGPILIFSVSFFVLYGWSASGCGAGPATAHCQLGCVRGSQDVPRTREAAAGGAAAGCMALEGMVGLRCNQESGDVDNPASSDDCHIHWKSTNADWPASSD